MCNRFFLFVLAAAGALAIGYATQSNENVTIPISEAQANNGRQMYLSYCASCHGIDGRADGPVAPALKIPPTDLTQLSNNNHGKYPSLRVLAVLQFGTSVRAHGTKIMPVWGPVFAKIDRTNPRVKELRISNLNHYIGGIQAK
jgi:mono/diheme cytochrome c family protein